MLWRIALTLPLLAVGCGSAFPKPALAPQPPAAFSEVPYPPPPARVEMVPERPKGDPPWIDGSWVWEGGQWRWLAGGWVVPAQGSVYSLSETRRRPDDGAVLYAPAAWRMPDGQPAPPPQVVAAATPSGKTEVEKTP
jgi:hypothetical protein